MRPHPWVVAAVISVVGLACLSRDSSAPVRPPNIVLIVADDLGYADIGVHGSKDITTPNIDTLAATGIRFTNAYVSGPYCSPTRAGLLTGRYPQRFGHEFNIGSLEIHREAGLPVNEMTIADRLKSAD
jgi:arylsulfatase A-like enzyme